jgi:hypothetical protein
MPGSVPSSNGGIWRAAGKVDRARLDYRPPPKQRSTIELLKYLSMMGPTFVQYALADTPDAALWTNAAKARDFDQTLAAIAAQADTYASLLADVTDADFRAEVTGIDGQKTSRGALIVNMVLSACAAYRTSCFYTSRLAAAKTWPR